MAHRKDPPSHKFCSLLTNDRHSAVSWASNEGSKNVVLLDDYPAFIARSRNDKVPSAITYVNGQASKWGYEVGIKDDCFRDIKRLLERDDQSSAILDIAKDSQTLLRKLGKTPQEVVADYLKFLWEYAIANIHRSYPNHENHYSKRAILTVPAFWSPAAKDRLIQAARLAGMPSNICLVAEPEAAALVTLRDRAKQSHLKVCQSVKP